MIRHKALAALACALPAALLVAAAPAPQIEELDEVLVTAKVIVPLEHFVEFPKYDSVAVSPDATRLAAAWIDDQYQRAMVILELPTLKTLRGYALSPTYSLADVSWANSQRLVLEPYWPHKGFRRLRESVGVIMTSDVYGGQQDFINRETLNMGDPLATNRRDEAEVAAASLKGTPDAGEWPGRNAQGPVRLVRTFGGDSGVALFQTRRSLSRSGDGEGYGLYELDLASNQQTRIATLPVNGGQFVFGPDNRAALATGINARNEEVVYYLPPDVRAAGRDWQLVASSKPGLRGMRPVAWTGKGEEYYALDGSFGGTRAVVAWNAADDTRRVLYRSPTADIEQVSLDPDGRAWMFQGSDHFPLYWYPDPEHPLARLHQLVRQKAPDELVEVVSVAHDLSIAVVRVSSGRRPPVYLVLNVGNGNSITGLFTYPTLRSTRLSRVDPIEFTARDGTRIRGYLTTPEDGNGKPRTGLPLLVIAHDGPLGEAVDSSYQYERQLFASRGYAVLQVNRRGSPGRGAPFERAGDGKWGRETQDDYADAVKWAIRDGVADGERVCFYGTGYGAYSAMVTAARQPALFKCVIGVAGVYDLPRLLGSGKQDIEPALAQVLGTDMKELTARSPVSIAGEIKAKVLLMPQERDEFFPADQSNRMRSALKAADNAPQYQTIGQEYGGQHSPATRANGYDVILKFLDRQIGEDAQ